jgi:type I restriction enzyme S subunit
MRPLGSALRVRKEKVDRTNVKFSDLQPITIHFDGSIDRRKVDGDSEYTMELFTAKPGDIVVAKIDLKNGAVGIVPEGWNNVVVTGHFAVYEPDRSKLVPEYLCLLIQTEFFKAHLWRNKVGAEGRKEVKLDFLEAELIPFPPLPVQHKIVAAWEAARKAAAETTAKIEQLELDIEARFLADLGIDIQPFFRRNRHFTSSWYLLERWGVEFNRWEWTLSELLKGDYPLRPLSELAWVNPTRIPRLERSARVSFVPMEAVDADAGEITGATEREISEVRNGFTAFQDGDVLWAKITPCMENGKCAVAKSLLNGVGYGSTEFHVIRPRDVKTLIPEFLWALLRLRRLREAARRYFIGSAGQQRVPPQFLRELPIPVIPVYLQSQMAERVAKRREEIATLKAEDKARAEAAKADVEAMILGAKKPHRGRCMTF